MLLDEVHESGGARDKHTGVPAVLTRGEVLGGGAGIGLLLERADKAGARSRGVVQGLAELDITEAGGRVRRGDTNSNEVTSLGDVGSFADSAEESILAGNHVIGGKGANDGIGVALGENGGGETNGGHGVLGTRLGEEVVALELGELALDGLGVGRTGNNGHAGGTSQGDKTVPGGLEHGAAREGDIEQELGVVLAGQRPETGTGTTSGDDDVETGNLIGGRGGGEEGLVARRVKGESRLDAGERGGGEERRGSLEAGAGGREAEVAVVILGLSVPLVYDAQTQSEVQLSKQRKK